LSSCEDPNGSEVEESIFEGVVLQYLDNAPISNAQVIITRGEAYSQLIDDFVNPISDTLYSDIDGYYQASLPKDPNRGFYRIQASKEAWKYRPIPFSIAKGIQEGAIQRDTLNMGTPAWLKLDINYSGTAVDSIFIRLSPNIEATGGFAFNPTIYRLYNLNADSIITHIYYYEDDPQIEVTWERLDLSDPEFTTEAITLIPRDTVVYTIP